MLAPFEEKSRLGASLDRLGVRLLVLLVCFLWFFRLWGQFVPALMAGISLGILVMYTMSLGGKRALMRRESALRRRIGGTIALESLLLCPATDAARQATAWLGSIYALDTARACSSGILAEYHGQTLLIQCLQTHPRHASGANAILSAQRALLALPEAQRGVLCAIGRFDAEATALAESLDPPLRLIDGDALAAIAGRLAPATDQQLAALGQKKRKPFSWASLRRHVFAPRKTRRYVLYGTGLMVCYILTDALYYLLPAGLCLLLAMLSQRRGDRPAQL